MRSLVALTIFAASHGHAEDADSRELVPLPEPMQRHMLANMRDHLLAIAQIQDALAEGRYDDAARIAEQRLGMSSLASHGASHMAPHMPESMRAIGSAMHRAASQFAITAEDASVTRDLAGALKGLSSITQQCVACHASYRIR